MTSNELKELVKSHFNLVDAEVNVTETIEETFTEESFGEIADENKAFTLRFPGEELAVGDKVTVVTTDGQEMDAPDGEHKLEGGIMIVTKDSVVESIDKPVAETTEEVEAAPEAETMEEEEAELISEEMMEVTEEVVEEIIEEVKEAVSEDMMEEPAVDAKAIIEAIAEEVAEEMGKLKEKMEMLEDKVAKFEMQPAAEKTIVSGNQGPQSRFSAVDNNVNSKEIEMMKRMIKNKK